MFFAIEKYILSTFQHAKFVAAGSNNTIGCPIVTYCVTPIDFRDIRPPLAHSWRKNVRSVDYSPPVLRVRM